MAKEVTIKGGTLDGSVLQNAATESTLKDLVNALTKKGGAAAGDEVTKLFNKSLKENIVTVNETSKGNNVFGDTLKRANTTTDIFKDKLSSLASIIGTGVSGVFSGMMAAGGLLIDFFKSSLDAWRSTSSVGASFNNSMIELQKTAAAANMPLADFVKLIGENSSSLAILGGTVTQGAHRFGELTTELNKTGITDQFLAMGLSISDINSGMVTYMDGMSRSGQLSKMSNSQIVQGSKDYLEQMDLLSKATGMSRKEIEDQAKKANVDPIINAMRAAIDPASKEFGNSSANMALMTKMGGQQLQDSLKSLAAGVPDEFGKMLLSSGVSMDKATDMFTGAMKPEDMIAFMKSIKPAADALGANNKTFMAFDKNTAALGGVMQNVGTMSADGLKKAAEEQAKRDTLTAGMATFGNTIETAINAIKTALLESGVLKLIGEMVGKFAEAVKNNLPKITAVVEKMIKNVDGFLTKLLDGIDKFDFNSLMSDIAGGFETLLSAASPILGDMVKKLFGGIMGGGGGSPEDDKKKKELEAKKSALEKSGASNPQMIASGAVSPDDAKELASINSQLDDLNKKTSGSSVGSFFSGLVDTFKNLAVYTAVGTGVVILGLLGLGYALGTIALPLSGILLALGFASGGLGYMFSQLQPLVDSFGNVITKTFDGMATVIKSWGDAFKSIFEGVADAIKSTEGPLNAFSNIIKSTFEGISVVIKSFSDAFARIPETLSQLSKISAGDLLSVGAALVPLSAGLTTLAAPGLVAFFLGGSLDKLTDTLLKFNSLSPEGLSKTGSALKQFGSDVSTLLEGGSWFRGLTSNDGGLAAIATSLKVFNDINPEPILRLTPVLKQFGDAARSLIEGGSWWQGLVGNDGGLAGIAKSLGFFNLVNPEIMIKLSPVLIEFGAAARSLIEGGSWWQGLIGNDGGLAGIAKSLSEFNAVNPDILIRITPVLIDFGKGARSLIEGGSWWEGLIGNDGGLAGIAKSLAEFNNINPETLARITPILVDFGKGARTLIEGGSWWQGLVGNDGGLAEIAKSLAAFNAVNGENLTALTPILVNFGKGARTLIEGGSWWAGLTATDGGLTSLATTLSSFNKVNGSNLAALAPALVTFNTGAKTLIEGGSWWKSLTSSDGGLTSLANTLTSFNAVDGTNMNNIVSGMTGLKKAVDVNFKDSSENITNFRDSIKELNDELSNLSKKLSDIKGTSIGSTSTGSSSGSSSGSSGLPSDLLGSSTTTPADKADKLNNMVSEMLELTKLIRDNTKDTADGVKGRNKVI